MSPLVRSLLALAAAALLHGACAAPQQVNDSQCTLVMHGYSVGTQKDLPVVYINRGTQNAAVDILNVCSSANAIIGEQVIVCDDVAPEVQLEDLPVYTLAYVYRKGDYKNYVASVQVTFWCNE